MNRRAMLLAAGAWALFLIGRYGVPPIGLQPRAMLQGVLALAPFDSRALAEAGFRFLSGHASILPWMGAVTGLGTLLLAWLGRRRRGGDRLCALGAGLVAGSPVAVGLGLTGLWFPVVVWPLTIAGLAGLVLRRRGRRAPSPPAEPRWLRWVLLAELAAVTAMVVTACLGPETHPDPLYYLLACPERFIREHKVVCLPHHAYAALPGGMSPLYGWQMLMGGEAAVRAWRPWLFAATLAVLWRIGRALGAPGAGLAAAAVFGTMPVFAYHAMHVKDDAEAAFLGLLALLAVVEARRGRRGRAAPPLAALLAGAAVAVKLTAAVSAPWILLAAALPGGRRGRGRRLLVCAAAAAVCLVPWWSRNALDHASPLYPFATRAFQSGRQLTPLLRVRMGQELTDPVRPVEGRSFGTFLALAEHVSLETGPAVAAALPLALLAAPAGPGAQAIRLVALAGLATWATLTNYPRFGLVPWALLVLIALLAVRRLAGRSESATAAAGLVAAVVAAANLGAVFPVWRGEFGGPALATGRLRPGDLVRQRIGRGPWALLERVGAGLPGGAKVLLAGDHRALYWPVRVVNQSYFDIHLLDRVVQDSADERRAAARLRQLCTHVYLNDEEAALLKFTYRYPILHFDGRARAMVQGLWARFMDETGRAGPAGLYRVRRAPRERGTGPALPLCLDEPGLERRSVFRPRVTWEGGGKGP